MERPCEGAKPRARDAARGPTQRKIANGVAQHFIHVGGVVIVETIFNYPGLASLMVDAGPNANARGAGVR